MKFTLLTLFPDMVRSVLGTSMLDRAAHAGTVEFEIVDLRQWGEGPHQKVDDAPYGGGAGMVLKVDVVDRALAKLTRGSKHSANIVLLTPQGHRFSQQQAEQLATDGRDLILIAGHYEGFDERIRSLVDEEISIGDFVLTGGELPALMIVDAVTRLLPGSLGSDDSVKEESFSLTVEPLDQARGSSQSLKRLLEYPHYTRPETYKPLSRQVGELVVPAILKSGDHGKIASWRQQQALERTRTRRPDLIK